MKIFNISGARKRRNKMLLSTRKERSSKDRYRQAFNKCMYIQKHSQNPLTRLRAKTDANYFKRKLERYK